MVRPEHRKFLPFRHRHPILNGSLQWGVLLLAGIIIRVVIPGDASALVQPLRWLGFIFIGLAVIGFGLLAVIAYRLHRLKARTRGESN